MTNRFPAGAAVLAALIAAMPGTADAFKGKRGTTINPVDSAIFEVLARTAGSGPDYWCGAADYARRALGADWTATIYIARGRGPSVTTNRRSAVHYTLDPAAAGITPIEPAISLNALKVGDNMSVQQANGYCVMPSTRF